VEAPAAPPPLPADGQRLEDALRAWRLERCRRDGVPAFIVLHDRHLRALATTRPATRAELARMDGIGPAKLERYGEEILAVLRAGRPTIGP
jgi:ATP-dependent DNA helicase RecQ